jgi:hypothetical protein
MKLNPEKKFLEHKQELLKLQLNDYKKLVIEYLNDGIYWDYFYNETTELYSDKLKEFEEANGTYLYLLEVFKNIEGRYAIGAFNKVIGNDKFKQALINSKISEDEFIRLYATNKSIIDISSVHLKNKNNTSLIFNIYYNDDLKNRISILKLPIFLKEDSEKIVKTNNKLKNILYPQTKKQELYPLTLLGVEFTVREVATFIIFISNYYNIKPKHKSELLDIAYLVFGDINLELKSNITTNNSALYDFITYGKGLFVDGKYDYSVAKSKILEALSYKETTKFKRIKSYIRKNGLEEFKSLIKKK